MSVVKIMCKAVNKSPMRQRTEAVNVNEHILLKHLRRVKIRINFYPKPNIFETSIMATKYLLRGIHTTHLVRQEMRDVTPPLVWLRNRWNRVIHKFDMYEASVRTYVKFRVYFMLTLGDNIRFKQRSAVLP